MIEITIVNNKQYYQEFCPECHGNVISVQEKGETVCSQCGLIINEKEFVLSYGEKRAFNREEKAKKARTGILISPLLSDIGLCTLIDKKNIHNPDLKRAVKRDSYLSWKNRNLLIAITELKRLSSNLNIPSYVIKVAFELYKRIYKNNLIKGRSIKGMAAACIYYACKTEKIPRSFQEILDESPISCKTIKKCSKIIFNHFNLKLPSTNIVSFIPKYIVELGLNINVEKLAIKILDSFLKKTPNNGKNPKGLCAGVIYLASKLRNIKVTQKDISKIIGITEVTLRSRYKELISKIDLFVN